MKKEFFIHIESIPKEGLMVKADWDAQVIEEILQDEKREFSFSPPLHIEFSSSLIGNNVIIEGNFELQLKLICVSCLSQFRWSLKDHFRYVLWPKSKDKFISEKELQQDDLEVAYYQSEVIDIRPFIREQIYLGLPQNPHCRENCLGLCPQCGINLNKKRCNCSGTPKGDSPFHVLKKLSKSPTRDL